MKDLAKLQLVVICLSWFVALIFSELSVAVSVLLGGLTYFIPTLLSIVVLTRLKKTPELLPIALLIVEVHKIVVTVVIIVTIYFLCPEVNWIGYLVGLILVTQVGLLMFRKSSYL
ncbi:MAG: hypothetical protein GKC53_04835 [Neisseriaceae bacterium]|nr:MAG: hypothetical protein GKC53_04835 [Neisseriaceae bacterium]